MEKVKITTRTKIIKSQPCSQILLVNSDIAQQIIRQYQGDKAHNFNPNTLGLGFGFLHYAIIRNIRPERVLCVGSTKGFIPAICAWACRDNHFGKVEFVDAGYSSPHPKNWGGIGLWSKKDFNKDKHFAFGGLNRFINVYIMTSEEFAAQSSSRYGYIHVDGDHSYEGVKKDFELWWPKLEKNGFIVFHDSTQKIKTSFGILGVRKLFEEIKKRKDASWIDINLAQGLAIIQKH